MATCNDCIHSGTCEIQLEPHYLLDRVQKLMRESDNVEHECLSFRDRSRFVELPCKVGDILYHPVPLRNMIAEYKIKSFQIYPHCVWVNWDIVDGVATINMSGIYANEIGKTVFLTKEQAEQALKEREENGKC